MPHTDETVKLSLVDEAAALADLDVAGAGDESSQVAGFTRALYQNVPAADLAARSPRSLLDAASALWRFAATREAGRPKVAISRSSDAMFNVVQVVNDDMPFLVDSVTAVLAGFGFDVALVIHPVFAVTRDTAGRRLACGPDLPGGHRESMMHLEFAGELAEERRASVLARLEAVLADVRSVSEDTGEMRDVAARVARESRLATGSIPAVEGAETAAFADWLLQDNFLFFGTRDHVVEQGALLVVAGTGRGLVRDDLQPVFSESRTSPRVSPDVQAFLSAPHLTMISKSNHRCSVHRPVPPDTILVKRFDADGTMVGLRLLLGLFTPASYFRQPQDIPVLRLKLRRCEERSGFAPDSHDSKALEHVLNTFPRDELFQIDEQRLLETALGILHLQQRPRIALFALPDPFGRSATCLVYLPRDRYSAEVRQRMAAILEKAFGGQVASDSTHFDHTALAHIHFVIAIKPGQSDMDPARPVVMADVEQQLAEAGRAWVDRLSEALGRDAAHPADTLIRYAAAFPTSYTERFAAQTALRDIHLAEAVAGGAPIVVSLYDVPGLGLRLKTFHAGAPVALSDVLPMLENIGMRVLNETPFQVEPRAAAAPIWIQEFELSAPAGTAVDVAAAGARFEELLREVWTGTSENDGFNRLVLTAGLSAREIVVLRAYWKHFRQAGSAFSQAYVEATLSAHPDLSAALVRLFAAQFDPHAGSDARQRVSDAIHREILAGLEQVENLDEDRILRGLLTLIRHTLRTNFYQHDASGQSKPYMSIKLSSRDIALLPLPRPMVEIFVYSPRMEGCHLRGGKVARGGIRWSDRKEDFRTEILGLMKAQMVKNAVIVPIGSKGGFVVKRPPEGGREALMAEVVACYRMLMSGLLDLTDNIKADAIVPPVDVVRHDPDDPYLVVAADKGTATFSDIANGVSHDYGFWLGDAFASGGSVGYDHKVMGITAKGAWEAVKRHFREIGTDIQTTPFSCVGIGDMSGDVFGNGMLLSRQTKLIAAFNHQHIFIDPNPDPTRSWTERRRLFDLPRSSWTDYAAAALSPGGGIYERKAKSITLSAEARARLGLAVGSIAPTQLIQVLLRLDVDLLWFGGIGTYVKATRETQAEAGDRANDGLRIDAAAVRAKVVGEGANLAITQSARIEYALKGGRINTDAIDNSAGVDTSDHEVNIKIGLADAIAAGHVAAADRTAFLASMTDEVEHLVLRDNQLQTLATSLVEAEAADRLDGHVRLMRGLETQGKLDRAIEFLPTDDTIAQRRAANQGLVRPEIAVLLAYVKNVLYEDLLASDLPDAPERTPDLLGYFPQRLRDLAPQTLKTHLLRREIVATCVANDVVNRMGPSFVSDTQARTGRDATSAARAYLVVREVFDLPAVWHEVEAPDTGLSAVSQTRLLLAIAVSVEQAVDWFLASGLALDVATLAQRFKAGVQALAPRLTELLPASEKAMNESRQLAEVAEGTPPGLAARIVVLGTLSTAMDIVQISQEAGRDVVEVAGLYFAAGASFGLLTLRRQARMIPATTEWQRLAAAALVEDSFAQQRAIVRRRVAGAPVAAPDPRLGDLLADIARAVPPDLAMLMVASRRIRSLVA